MDTQTSPRLSPALRSAPYLLVALFTWLYSLLSLARWHRWDSPSWDNAIFEQAIKGWANFGAPIVDIKGPGYHQLGDHWSPLLAVIGPIYRIFPDPKTLLIVQAVLIAVSVWPITRYATKRFGWAGVAIGVAYGASWGLQAAVDVQFHEFCLAVPLLAFGLVAYLEKKWLASAIWICLLMGVKEDMGLVVFVFGLLLWWSKQRKLGAIVTGIGTLGMVLVLTVLVPIFNPWNQYDYWNKIETGTGAQEQSGGLGEFFTTLLTPDTKIATVAVMVLITLGLCLRSPITLMVVPTLCLRFISETETHWGTTWHYSSFLMPILFVAAIDALDRMPRKQIGRQLRLALPIAMAIVALILTTRFPLWNLTKPETYQAGAHTVAARDVVRLVPKGASVASDVGLITRFTKDHVVYWIGNTVHVKTGEHIAPDYISIYTGAGWYANPPEDIAAYAMTLHPGHRYVVAYDYMGYKLAQRVD